MGNLADYKRAWADHREAVKRIRGEYDDTIKGLEQYQGSAYGTEMEQAATARYQADLQAARESYGTRVSKVLEAMKKALEERENEVIPPTDEQLRTLEALRMMSTITPSEYGRYAEMMASSDVASRALHDVASERMPEGQALPEFKTKYDSAWKQAKALSREAKALNRWDASQGRGAALTDHLNATKGQQVRGIETPSGDAFAAACAGEIDPTLPNEQFYRSTIGMLLFDPEALRLLD